ncbi:hypothetical protein EJB05_31608, partial [Eragrostis curvula]
MKMAPATSSNKEVGGEAPRPHPVVACFDAGLLGLIALSTAITLAASVSPPPVLDTDAYFFALTGLFFAGVNQLAASVWAAGDGRRQAVGRKLVYASFVVPFIAAVAMSMGSLLHISLGEDGCRRCRSHVLGGNVADDNSNNDSITIVIDSHQLLSAAAVDGRDDADSSAKTQLAKTLSSMGFLTLTMDVATALYTPPQGVLFEGHMLAYYLTLVGIFAAGLVELFTAFCLSNSGQANGRLVSFARALICASVAPLVTIIALGGFSVLMKG